jgi:hypothetical protein
MNGGPTKFAGRGEIISCPSAGESGLSICEFETSAGGTKIDPAKRKTHPQNERRLVIPSQSETCDRSQDEVTGLE